MRSKSDGVIDPMWGIRVGDIAHNLRAALDNLTWQVSLLTTMHPSPRTQFPINLTKTGQPSFDRDAPIQLKTVALKHWALFERHQPYAGGNGGHDDPLWLLKKINDTDKHRVIHYFALYPIKGRVRVLNPSGEDLVSESTVDFELDALEHNAIVARLAADSSMHMELNLRVRVGFSQGSGDASTRPFETTCTLMRDRVLGIIDSFAHLFPQP